MSDKNRIKFSTLTRGWLIVLSDMTSTRILALTIVHRTAKAILVETEHAEIRGRIFHDAQKEARKVWLPLSQVILKDGKVVEVANWLKREHSLATDIGYYANIEAGDAPEVYA